MHILYVISENIFRHAASTNGTPEKTGIPYDAKERKFSLPLCSDGGYMKRILAVLCMLSLLFSAFCFSGSAEGKAIGFYIPRAGGKRPRLPAEEAIIEKHGGYYIDRHVDDDSERRVLYLTFDAGYENGNVKKILDTLAAEDVPAAFFVLDHLILENTDLVCRMQKEGHLVCNHTKNHKDMTKCTKEEMKKNLTDLEKLCEEKTGCALAKYFRFPEGRFNEDALVTAEELGYRTVFWSFAYADWDNGKQPDPARAKKKILENTHNGEVILLHPTSATNAEILPELIREWKAMGYTFGTLDELTAD